VSLAPCYLNIDWLVLNRVTRLNSLEPTSHDASFNRLERGDELAERH